MFFFVQYTIFMLIDDKLQRKELRDVSEFLINLSASYYGLSLLWFGIYQYVIPALIANGCVFLAGVYHLQDSLSRLRYRRQKSSLRSRTWRNFVEDLTHTIGQQSVHELCHFVMTLLYFWALPLLSLFIVPTYAQACALELLMTCLLVGILLLRWLNSIACRDACCLVPAELLFFALLSLLFTSHASLAYFALLMTQKMLTSTPIFLFFVLASTLLQRHILPITYPREFDLALDHVHHCAFLFHENRPKNMWINLKKNFLHLHKLTLGLLHTTLCRNKLRDTMLQYYLNYNLTKEQTIGLKLSPDCKNSFSEAIYSLGVQKLQYENYEKFSLGNVTGVTFDLPLQVHKDSSKILSDRLDMHILNNVKAAYSDYGNFHHSAKHNASPATVTLSGEDDESAVTSLDTYCETVLSDNFELPVGKRQNKPDVRNRAVLFLNDMKDWIANYVEKYKESNQTQKQPSVRARAADSFKEQIEKIPSVVTTLKPIDSLEVVFSEKDWKAIIHKNCQIFTLASKTGYLPRLAGLTVLFALAALTLRTLRLLCLSHVRLQVALSTGVAMTNGVFLVLALLTLYAYSRCISYAAEASTYDFCVKPLKSLAVSSQSIQPRAMLSLPTRLFDNCRDVLKTVCDRFALTKKP